jgi:hypothetical protein
MRTLADDPSLRARMAEAGKMLVSEEFAVGLQVRRSRELYEASRREVSG